MSTIVPARLVRVADVDAHEGPVVVGDGLFFTSVRRGDAVAIRRLDLATRKTTTLVENANAANGMTLDRDGRLLVCEQGTLESPARIARLDPATGTGETVVSSVFGRPLNSPNDITVGANGRIWFTDPSYGHLQGFRPAALLSDTAYRFDPVTDEISAVPWEFDKPNGIALSPDGRTLYVSDNGAPHHVVSFDVAADGATNGRVLAVGTPEHPDGLKVDAAGRIYASAAYGIQIFGADGRELDSIDLPGAVNFAFGREGLLYVTTDTAIWAVDLKGR
jgi:gluconolactonase